MQSHRQGWKSILRKHFTHFVPEQHEVQEVVVGVGEFQCRQCELRFRTTAHRASHEWRAHKVMSQAGQWSVNNTMCQACCVEFHASARLAQHFKGRPGCLRAVMAFFPEPCERDEAATQPEVARRKEMKLIGRNDQYADKPSMRVSGACLPAASQLQNGGRNDPEMG